MEFITSQDQKFLIIDRSETIDEKIIKRNWWNIEAIIKNGNTFLYCQGVHDIEYKEINEISEQQVLESTENGKSDTNN